MKSVKNMDSEKLTQGSVILESIGMNSLYMTMVKKPKPKKSFKERK